MDFPFWSYQTMPTDSCIDLRKTFDHKRWKCDWKLSCDAELLPHLQSFTLHLAEIPSEIGACVTKLVHSLSTKPAKHYLLIWCNLCCIFTPERLSPKCDLSPNLHEVNYQTYITELAACKYYCQIQLRERHESDLLFCCFLNSVFKSLSNLS